MMEQSVRDSRMKVFEMFFEIVHHEIASVATTLGLSDPRDYVDAHCDIGYILYTKNQRAIEFQYHGREEWFDCVVVARVLSHEEDVKHGHPRVHDGFQLREYLLTALRRRGKPYATLSDTRGLVVREMILRLSQDYARLLAQYGAELLNEETLPAA